MSFVGLLSRAWRLFASRSLAFRTTSLVLAGATLFVAFSLGSSALRSAYWGIAYNRVVKPFETRAKARSDAKQRVLVAEEAAKEDALRRKVRQTGSLSSPYVEVGGDASLPLLVRVWLNVDPSHTVSVSNNDARFPLVYERAVSEQGFVPVVDDFGSVRWVYRWTGVPNRGRGGYTLLGEVQDGRIFINGDEGIKVVSFNVFGDRKVVFDGESYSQEHDYKVHHALRLTDKGTLLLVADPIEKRPMLEDQGILPHKKRDWMHLNALYYDSASETIILSGRNQSAFPRSRTATTFATEGIFYAIAES